MVHCVQAPKCWLLNSREHDNKIPLPSKITIISVLVFKFVNTSDTIELEESDTRYDFVVMDFSRHRALTHIMDATIEIVADGAGW